MPQVAVFPAIFFPTRVGSRRLGAGHVIGFLPVWAQKSFGEWTTYGGGGYWINQDEATGERTFGSSVGYSNAKSRSGSPWAERYSIKPLTRLGGRKVPGLI